MHRIKEQLEAYVKANPGAVLAPAILKNWDEILRQTRDAYGNTFGEVPMQGDPPVPAVLERVSTWPALPNTKNAFAIWVDIERFLRAKGYTKDDITYYDCGCEALVFKIKGIEDVLMKISVYHELDDSSFVLRPLGRHKETETENGMSQTLSLALVPNLTGSYDTHADVGVTAHVYKPIGDQHMDLALSPEDQEKLAKPTVKLGMLKAYFNHEKLEYHDPKPLNTRCIPEFPHLPMVIDRRAVDALSEHPSSRPDPLTPPQEQSYHEAQHAAELLQQAIQLHLGKKYQVGETAFNSVLKASRQLRSPPSDRSPS